MSVANTLITILLAAGERPIDFNYYVLSRGRMPNRF